MERRRKLEFVRVLREQVNSLENKLRDPREDIGAEELKDGLRRVQEYERKISFLSEILIPKDSTGSTNLSKQIDLVNHNPSLTKEQRRFEIRARVQALHRLREARREELLEVAKPSAPPSDTPQASTIHDDRRCAIGDVC